MIWRIVTGEYPPHLGGVSAYTQIIAHGLAGAGDEVEVYAPGLPALSSYDGPVRLQPLRDDFGPSALLQLHRALGRAPNCRLLIQYVPQSFGLKGLNLPFVWWLAAHRGLRPIVMFHEVTFPIARSAPLRRNLLGLISRRMAAITARAAARVFVSTPVWAGVLREQCGFSGDAAWLPLPSTIAVARNEGAVLDLRRRYGADTLLGHFGGYPEILGPRLTRLFACGLDRHPNVALLLLGAGGAAFRAAFAISRPDLARRIFAPGALSVETLSHHLSACDLMLQLYPDGACARRTTLIAALAHGLAVMTSEGPATESIWREGRALALCPDDDDALLTQLDAHLAQPERRRALGAAGAALYRQRFASHHSIRRLRSAGCELQ